jgi:hypothetical protein
MAKVRNTLKFRKTGSSWGRDAPSKRQYIEALVQSLEKEINSLMKTGKPTRLTMTIDPHRMLKLPKIERTSVKEGAGRTPKPTWGLRPESVPPKLESLQLKAALSEAFERGGHLAAKILRQSDMLTAGDFAASLNLSRETVRQKMLKHEILAVRGAKQGHRFPAWQVTTEGRLLPELPRLFELLGGNPWTVYRFLLQHHPELDGATAFEALKTGKVEDVLAAAKNVGLGFS